MSIVEIAQNAREASNLLQLVSSEQKSLVLKSIKNALSSRRAEIFKANEEDLALAEQEVNAGRLKASLFKRLDIRGKNDEKFETMLEGIDEVDLLADPIGVVLAIFEARPEVVVNIACLAIKSSNAAILKGGKEANKTNHVLAQIIKQAISSLNENGAASSQNHSSFPENAVQLVSTRDEIKQLLDLDKYIDLVVPRGSNSLVKSIQNSTRIPVLGHADGLCSIYIDKSCDASKASRILVDAKTSYPAACNSVETLLVHKDALANIFPEVAESLIQSGVTLHLDSRSKDALLSSNKNFSQKQEFIKDATAKDFDTEFLSLDIAVKVVGSVDEAIDHINKHGSKHTDCIITDSEQNGEYFMKKVDSAGVYMNASTRFADGFRYGFGAEVGVSTNKTHARGPVGLEGLTIYKYKLYGNGNGSTDYGPGKKQYLHEDF
ncbi:hypothetical protein BB560_007286 [Smittium megazygosporum]|uniref:glutamate-5-semialdehyde dehydrogenase n=1 Tax=Smittium megazygosporum TaxID=133381 RepID=A0A2T9XXC4_9FUNG|nr:hypothetical protein BB560_007286 [Smittium megazygosporum]